ncbi:MAG: exodeoxyribonuclease VII large subunit [Erysipelotrichaceae bacterium]
MSRPEIAISDLVKYLKRLLDNTEKLHEVRVVGEISNLTKHRSGHWYFTLKDEQARLSCVMFKSYANRVAFEVKEGQKVVVIANVTVYEASGSLQLFALGMESKDDIGDLYAQYQKRFEQLEKAGYFNAAHKKTIPAYPERIGLLSAKEGAATQDVLHILKRRWPLAEISFYPCLVQGDKADLDIMEKLQVADTEQHDLLLLCRGGGSIEDLWCFNSEALVKTIYNLQTPIVVGVGHEPDHTLVEYVADLFAPTPSAAAELISPNQMDVKIDLLQKQLALQQALAHRTHMERMRLDSLQTNRYFRDPHSLIQNEMLQLSLKIKQLSGFHQHTMQLRQSLQQRIAALQHSHTLIQQNKAAQTLLVRQQLSTAIQTYRKEQQKELAQHIALLDAYSPLKVLQRGYSIVQTGEHVITSVDQIEIGQAVQIRLLDGQLEAKIQTKEHIDGKEKL